MNMFVSLYAVESHIDEPKIMFVQMFNDIYFEPARGSSSVGKKSTQTSQTPDLLHIKDPDIDQHLGSMV